MYQVASLKLTIHESQIGEVGFLGRTITIHGEAQQDHKIKNSNLTSAFQNEKKTSTDLSPTC